MPYTWNVVDSARVWFHLSPERGTAPAIINEAEARLWQHDVGGLLIDLGEAGPDSRMYKRGWTINLEGGKPVEKKPTETSSEKPPLKGN